MLIRRSAIGLGKPLVSKRPLITVVETAVNRNEFYHSLVENCLCHSYRSCASVYAITQHRRFSSSSSFHSCVTKNDCFGELVTVLDPECDHGPMMSAYDTFLWAVLTKGRSTTGGGDEEGLQIKASHATALVWAELLETNLHESVPMLAVVAISPILAQADMTYLNRVDELLRSTKDKIQLKDIALKAACNKDNSALTNRERQHLTAFDLLIKHKRIEALKVYLNLLRLCPGDALALSLAIDLASTLGDKRAAFLAATTVYTYWQERKHSITGYSIATSYTAVGLAAGGRVHEAEGLLQRSTPIVDLEGSSSIASWASGLVYDAEGRAAEGVSSLSGSDGVKNFNSAGLLFFDSRLGGYGARFSLDREGDRNARSILRVYDECYTRIMLSSGYAQRQPHTKTERRVPTYFTQRLTKPAKSLFQSIFGGKEENLTTQDNKELCETTLPTTVDTLTWLPPTPQLLHDATFLLLRITLHRSISSGDSRWIQLKNSWLTLLDQYEGDYSSLPSSIKLASALACHDVVELHFEGENSVISGARQLGALLCLGSLEPTTQASAEDWKKVVLLLSESLEESNLWDIDARPLFEVALCHAACMTENDFESLCIARSVCSKGVALRVNSPEEWTRYSMVLDALGDEVAADAARTASISMGAGERAF